MPANKPPSCVIADPKSVEARTGTGYPPPYAEPCLKRIKRALGDAVGLKTFGVNMTELPPGTWSAQRHWHTRQDEFIYVVEGEMVLVTDEGEFTLKAGMSAGFPAGVKNGHHLINKSSRPAVYLEIGDRTAGDQAFYPEADLEAHPGPRKTTFTHRGGKPY
ncbi:MAG TPA: cupin domain-containing protein [Alphaproteobacteria bacterium]|nr:cupin domain-containing protein [Alphaproteobacteria bacterium]